MGKFAKDKVKNGVSKIKKEKKWFRQSKWGYCHTKSL